MTLKEIAAEAGVSISTVSRVINGNSKSAASKEVQERILEIARRNNYISNGFSRDRREQPLSSSHRSLHSIACLFARVPDGESDFFFSTLARSIEKEAFQRNYVLQYTFSAFDIDDPFTMHLIASNQVDGIAVLGRCSKQLLKFLQEHFKHVVYAGLNNIDANYDQIICDGKEAAISVVNHLIQLGHKKIAYVGETQNEKRFDGYCEALKQANLPLRKEYITDILLSTEGGYKGAKQLLEQGCDVTAFFCPDDLTSIGAMRAIQERGLRIPEDISVISIDDIDTAQYLTPRLTTVHVPVEEMGKMAAKMLIDRIEGGHELPMKLLLPYHIEMRESCGPCNNNSL